MTTPLSTTVTLTDPGEVLAAVPHLLGFNPADSLVLITVHGVPGSGRIGLTARLDLPSPDEFRRVADHLVLGPITSDGADAVILAVVDGRSVDDAVSDVSTMPRQRPGDVGAIPRDLPYAELIGAIRAGLSDAGVELVHAVWTSEIRHANMWRCYERGRLGDISDPESSPLAAAMAASGAVTFKNRDELVELIAPESAESIAWRSARLNGMYENNEQERTPGEFCGRDLEVVFGAIRRTGEGSALTEDDLLRVLIAVSDFRVRDMVMGMALTEWADAAEQLWLSLVRKAPDPEVADVAALLAFSAYLRGDGALAGIALERIESCRPDHRLGVLLRRALDAGVTPSSLAVIAEDAVADARIMMQEDGG